MLIYNKNKYYSYNKEKNIGWTQKSSSREEMLFQVHTCFNSLKAQVIENGCLLFVYDHLITYCKVALCTLCREEREWALELKLDRNCK